MASMHHPKTILFLSVSLILSLLGSADAASVLLSLANELKPMIKSIDELGNKMSVKYSELVKSKLPGPDDYRAVAECAEQIHESLHEVGVTGAEIAKVKSHDFAGIDMDDLLARLNAVQTKQDTCLDGFASKAAKKLRGELIKNDPPKIFRLVGDLIATIKAYSGPRTPTAAKLTSVPELADDWPKWISAGDRRLLQGSTVTPNVTVAADGSGNYRTVAAAVKAAPEGRRSRYVIRIKAGVYRETVEIPRNKTNLMFIGDGRKTTIITASRYVGDGRGSTTFSSATVAVAGNRFLARDITFMNEAGRSKRNAVALRVDADRCAFHQCNILAYRKTLYVHSYRQFYTGCVIAGTKDFIFGNAAVVFHDCDIRARHPNFGEKNTVTAQARDDPNQDTGIVIQKCRIRADPDDDLEGKQDNKFTTYLGRPWKRYSRTVVMQSNISDVIHKAGWLERGSKFTLANLFYAEYQNTGAGAGTDNRVKWGGFRVLANALQAQPFTAENFLGQGS